MQMTSTQNQNYWLVPGTGPLPLKLGMSISQVDSILGSGFIPAKSTSDKSSRWYSGVLVTFESLNHTLVWVGIETPNRVYYKDVNLFDLNGVQSLVDHMGQDAMDCVGYTVFDDLGVACDDFSSQDERDRTVCVFAPGTWSVKSDKRISVSGK
jgi:hypothetical protein